MSQDNIDCFLFLNEEGKHIVKKDQRGPPYTLILDSLDRYRDVIVPELVTWYQLRGSKLLYFPGRSLFGVILTSWWNEYIFNQCMSPFWGLYVTNFTHYTITEGHYHFFFMNFFFPWNYFFHIFFFSPKMLFWVIFFPPKNAQILL